MRGSFFSQVSFAVDFNGLAATVAMVTVALSSPRRCRCDRRDRGSQAIEVDSRRGLWEGRFGGAPGFVWGGLGLGFLWGSFFSQVLCVVFVGGLAVGVVLVPVALPLVQCTRRLCCGRRDISSRVLGMD